MKDIEKIEYWLREFGMPEENIGNCATQIAQGYCACRYLEGVIAGAEAVNELDKKGEASEDLEEEIHKEIIKLHTAPCYDELKAFALHFIEWQKEQIMKEAVALETEIFLDGGTILQFKKGEIFLPDDNLKQVNLKQATK